MHPFLSAPPSPQSALDIDRNSLVPPPLHAYLAEGGDARARAGIGPCIYPSACSNE